MVIGTQVAVAVTGTDQFCGTTCHSHEKFVYPEHQLSAHYNNRVGVRAMCVDCHVPHSYPAKLIVKAKKGIADAYAEMRGTISTQEKFDRERWRLANMVWDEMRADNSANCRHCHDPQAMDNKKQSEDAVKQHKKFASGKATCIDCHTGVAHKEPAGAEAAGVRRADAPLQRRDEAASAALHRRWRMQRGGRDTGVTPGSWPCLLDHPLDLGPIGGDTTPIDDCLRVSVNAPGQENGNGQATAFRTGSRLPSQR